MTAGTPPPSVLTIGHSTRPLEAFVALLRENGAARVVDVRTVPRSRRNPQFNADTLPAALEAAGIGYVHCAGLGGLRHPRRDSPNAGWHNEGFRGFADYMQTPEFEVNLERLMGMAQAARIVLMCAEAVPWRCHRSLIADALTLRGAEVRHIIGEGPPRAHRLTPWAQATGTTLTYPPPSGADVDTTHPPGQPEMAASGRTG